MQQQHFEQHGEPSMVAAGLSKKIKNFVFNQKDQIGKGYSSVVYRGVDDLTKEEIAIKVVELSKIKNEVQRHLLNNEMRALRKLQHPHIIRCLDILMTKNNIYIVTEFCRGGDMVGQIRQHGRLSEQQALAYLKEITEGYVFIEENGILHRDLKTANIFLNGGTTRIADFGFCEFVGEPRPSIAYNVGSPAYMSPEAYRESYYSNKSDVWSLGIIFYEMLAGEVPYKKSEYAELAFNLTNGNLGLPQGVQISDTSAQILIGCFREKLAERLEPKKLLDMINQELRRRQTQRLTLVQPHTLRTSFESITVLAQPPQPDNTTRVMHLGGPPPRHPPDSVSQSSSGKKYVSPQKINESNDIHIVDHDVVNGTATANQETIRQYIEYIMFLYRLAKLCSENRSLPHMNRILLSIMNNYEAICAETNSALGSREDDSAKEYQYLLARFEELGLTVRDLEMAIDPYSRVADSNFRAERAIRDSIAATKQALGELDRLIDQNQQTFGVLFDYLMLYEELLDLELQLKSVPEVVRTCRITDWLKQKPKTLTDAHIRLLRLKRSMLGL